MDGQLWVGWRPLDHPGHGPRIHEGYPCRYLLHVLDQITGLDLFEDIARRPAITLAYIASSSAKLVSIRQTRSGMAERRSRHTSMPSPSSRRTSKMATLGLAKGTRVSASAPVEPPRRPRCPRRSREGSECPPGRARGHRAGRRARSQAHCASTTGARETPANRQYARPGALHAGKRRRKAPSPDGGRPDDHRRRRVGRPSLPPGAKRPVLWSVPATPPSGCSTRPAPGSSSSSPSGSAKPRKN